jgi:hypothetical protein
MAGFATTFEYQLLRGLLNGNEVPATGTTSVMLSSASTSPVTSFWVSLHTADPTDSGTQGSNEGGYAAYTRIQTTRSTGTNGWVLASTNGAASPVSNIDFPQNTATSTGTFTHAALGWSSGATAGSIFLSGTLSPSINFSQNVTPRITTGSSITLD